MAMIQSGKKCSFLQHSKLTKYGNWCGYGNTGKTPIDPLDACCMSHDNCYGDVEVVDPKCSYYWKWYQWTGTVEDGSIACQDKIGISTKEKNKKSS